MKIKGSFIVLQYRRILGVQEYIAPIQVLSPFTVPTRPQFLAQRSFSTDFGQFRNKGRAAWLYHSTASTPYQLHRPDHLCPRPSSIFCPSMSPEGMVQRHLVDRELLKVRALFSVGMPTLFLGAAPKDACAVCFWHVVVYRSNDSMSTRSWWLWSS